MAQSLSRSLRRPAALFVSLALLSVGWAFAGPRSAPLAVARTAAPAVGDEPAGAAGALASGPAQEPPAPEAKPKGKQGRGQAGPVRPRPGQRRKQNPQSDRTYLFEARLADPEALAKGQAMLDRVLAAAGGWIEVPAADGGAPRRLPFLSLAPGLRYQQLEAQMGYLDNDGRLKVHHFVPRMVHLAADGQGYLYSELVHFQTEQDEFVPEYRREVLAGGVSWFEVDGLYSREEGGSAVARMVVHRELLFGQMPHGLAVLKPQLAWLEDQDAGGTKIGIYLGVLPQPIKGKPIDDFDQFIVYVDELNARILRIEYLDSGGPYARTVQVEPEGLVSLEVDPATQALLRVVYKGFRAGELAGTGEPDAAMRAQAEAESQQLVFPVRYEFPQAWSMSEETVDGVVRFEIAEPVFEPIPEQALVRPWQSGTTFSGVPRADHWDPPAKPGPKQD